MNVSELLARLRVELHDCKAKRWSDAYLLQVVNEYYCSSLRPDLLSKSKVVQLKVGDIQNLEGCCTTISGIDGIVDKSGNVVKQLKKENVASKSIYSRVSCAKPEADLPSSYYVNAKRPGVFYVDPPVKAGQVVKVRVDCVQRPKPIRAITDKIDIRCEALPELIGYVKSTALSTEWDSAASLKASAKVRAEYKADARDSLAMQTSISK